MIVDTVKDRIQNAFLTAIDCFITLKIELAISSTRLLDKIGPVSWRIENLGNT